MQHVIALCLVPFLLGLFSTVALHGRVRNGAAWTTIGGLGIAGALFVAAQLFASNVDSGSGDMGITDRDVFSAVIVVSLVLWLIGVGVAAAIGGVARLRERRTSHGGLAGQR